MEVLHFGGNFLGVSPPPPQKKCGENFGVAVVGKFLHVATTCCQISLCIAVVR